MKNQYQRLAEQYRQPIQELASQLIQIPSYSLQEKNIADFLYDKMTELGYDEVIRDEYGNIFGVLRGASDGPSLTLNCHMDTVHEGSMSGWPYPPYDAAIVDGRLWGRGASDTKGTMAIQLYAPVILRKAGILPAGNVVVACVVAEESPGYGTNMQCADRRLITDYAIMGGGGRERMGGGGGVGGWPSMPLWVRQRKTISQSQVAVVAASVFTFRERLVMLRPQRAILSSTISNY